MYYLDEWDDSVFGFCEDSEDEDTEDEGWVFVIGDDSIGLDNDYDYSEELKEIYALREAREAEIENNGILAECPNNL